MLMQYTETWYIIKTKTVNIHPKVGLNLMTKSYHRVKQGKIIINKTIPDSSIHFNPLKVNISLKKMR